MVSRAVGAMGAMGAMLGCSASGNESDSSRGTTAPNTTAGGTGGLAQDSATSGTGTGGSEQSPGSGGGDTPASGGGAGGDNSIAGQGGASGASVTPGPGGAAGLALEGQPCAGYTLLGIPENDAGADFTAMLIDMDGGTVHRWTITGFPPKMLPGGSLIGCVGVTSGSYDCRNMQQVSWDGDLEWSFSNWMVRSDGTTTARHHHDFEREGNPVGYYAPGQEALTNGSTLVLAHLEKTVAEIREGLLDDDVIYEVDGSGDRTAFEWHAADHLNQLGFDEAAREDLRARGQGDTLEWLHGNSLALVGPNHWYDEGHAEFHPDNIIYSSRQANIVLIISRETGDVVWRVGPNFEGRAEGRLGQFVGQHNPHMIPVGLPGAGNILVFDNGGGSGYGPGPEATGIDRYTRDYSRVLEFNPITFEVVWEYGAASGEENFFSFFISNAQRLPNGNTLITIGMETRIIEVTPNKEVVWDYVYTPTSSGGRADWLYRTYRVPPEWLPAGQNEAFADYASWSSLFE